MSSNRNKVTLNLISCSMWLTNIKMNHAWNIFELHNLMPYQFICSDSALFFKIHIATVLQSTERWASSVHCKCRWGLLAPIWKESSPFPKAWHVNWKPFINIFREDLHSNRICMNSCNKYHSSHCPWPNLQQTHNLERDTSSSGKTKNINKEVEKIMKSRSNIYKIMKLLRNICMLNKWQQILLKIWRHQWSFSQLFS